MSYLVFARKWRPQNFDQVIGQEHIATTLKNAIARERVAHAYLFAGPRGIGKTSTARILAKALNCEKGPASEPCNRCSFCLEISQGRSLDVIEIDGASNRGIEQIRQLRENIKFAPAKNRFKVYIIDEVHQITTDGFNALLKTLEEPPAHVKFIFATTQAHKVLSTILSRCQRFDFRPLTTSLITQKLKRIIKEEKLDVTDDALLYISRAAAGSMRDAESILDQLSSFCKGKIKLETVTSILGIIDFEAIWEIAQKIIERNATEALISVEKIINEGKDLNQFIAGLMEHFRNILITQTMSRENMHNLIDLPRDYVERIHEQGKGLNLEEIFYIFNMLVRAQENLKRSLSARVIAEMAVIKLAQRENLSSLEDILSKLTNLERSLKEAGSSQIHNCSKDANQVQLHQNNPEVPAQDSRVPTQKSSISGGSVPEDLSHRWLDLLQAIRDEKMFLASSLEFAEPTDLKGKVLTIAFPEKYNFYKETLEHPQNLKFIEQKAKEVFQRDLKVKFVLDKSSPAATAEEKSRSDEPLRVTEPIIQTALKIFHGRIVRRSSR